MKRLASLPKARLALWGLFLGGNVLLFLLRLDSTLMAVLAILLLLLLLLLEGTLLVLHRHFVAQWRAILLFIILYAQARWGAVQAHAADATSWTSLALAVALYVMFALWGAIIALAIARDVSVAYLAIFMLVAPILMRAALIQSGDVLGLLQANSSHRAFPAFSWTEPFVLAFSCFPTLGIITFLPHFLLLLYHEWQRSPLIKESNGWISNNSS